MAGVNKKASWSNLVCLCPVSHYRCLSSCACNKSRDSPHLVKRMATSWGAAFLVLVASCVCSTVFHRDQQTWFEGVFLSSMCPIDASASTLYGIMFDAGSTGTRIHVYTFVQKIPGQCKWCPCQSQQIHPLASPLRNVLRVCAVNYKISTATECLSSENISNYTGTHIV